jgi:hypothetical protein
MRQTEVLSDNGWIKDSIVVVHFKNIDIASLTIFVFSDKHLLQPVN